MKRTTALILTSVLLLSLTGSSVYAESMEGAAEDTEQETVEVSAPAPEADQVTEAPAPAPEADQVTEAPAPAPEEDTAIEASAEGDPEFETSDPAAEGDPEIEASAPAPEEELTNEGAAPVSEAYEADEISDTAPETQAETEETPLITLNTSEESEQVDRYDVQISWSVTEGDISLQSTYQWDPDELRYVKCGEDLIVNTAPGVDITIRNDSDTQISYVIEPRFVGDFGEKPQKITGTLDAGASEVISSRLEVTCIPEGYDGSEQIATYQISVFGQGDR